MYKIYILHNLTLNYSFFVLKYVPILCSTYQESRPITYFIIMRVRIENPKKCTISPTTPKLKWSVCN